MAARTTFVPNPLPRPLFPPSRPYYQSGITDPMWSVEQPEGISAEAIRDYLEDQRAQGRLGDDVTELQVDDQSLRDRYESDYAGRVDGQKFQSILRADVKARDRDELIAVLRQISEFAVDEMAKRPSRKHIRLLERIPDSYRVTITVGFGATLFVDRSGFDRFGLRGRRPKHLKTMPSFPGDADGFEPATTGSDLILVISSDHPYVNVAIVRFFAEWFNPRFRTQHPGIDADHDVLEFRGIEQGFARKDKREFLKFDDGIDNLNMARDELERLVYVDETDHEPEWCTDGTYLVYRKIRENMPRWEAMDADPALQSAMIGRDKATNEPLSRQRQGVAPFLPVYPDPKDDRDGPLNSHIRKVQPRRPNPDLFGVDDQDRRFLRRPYPFFDGLDEHGRSINGLQFLAFMRSIQHQFEHVANMWQCNRDFPVPGTGLDALYAHGILSNIDGGYYFCPPGLRDRADYFGSGMFR